MVASKENTCHHSFYVYTVQKCIHPAGQHETPPISIAQPALDHLDELGQSGAFEFVKDTLDPLLLPFFLLAIFDSICDL
eukprot:COSAG02_NODE_964_length_15595_cov_7.284709_16_plen_79_part_00